MNTSSNDTGSLSFALKWESPQNPNNMSLRAKGEAISELSYAPIDCTAIGVSTVTANVYDSGGTYITSGGPWNCADHSGAITGISAGINRMIAVSGKDSSSRIIYNGQITGVTINKDQTTNAGQITMTYVANDTTAPTDGTLSASAGNSQVSLSWSGWTDSGSGIGSYKLVYSTTSTPSSCSSGTQIFTGTGTSYTHTGLTNGSTYYYRICATDNAGNISNGATASGTPTASSGGTTTTGSAPSAPTGVSVSAGNGQTTISWSSVSGATSNIYWSTSSGVTKTTGTKITYATSPYTHTGRTNGTIYYYVVTAVNSYGESSESSPVSATPWDSTAGLVGYWELEGLTDSSGNGNTLTNNNSATFVAGKFNNGASFVAASSQYLSIANNLGIDGGIITLSAWAKFTDLPSVIYDYTIIAQSSANTDTIFAMTLYNIGGTQQVVFHRTKYGIIDQGVNYTKTLNTGQWYHFILTYDGTNIRGYLDGILVGTGEASGNGNNGAPNAVYIGTGWAANTGHLMNGIIDGVRVYNRTLSASEILNLYNNP